MDMTVKEAGTEGVYLAISDGMKAASYARKLDAMEAMNEVLTKENDSLKCTIACLERELAKERKRAKSARAHNRKVYRWHIDEQVEDGKTAPLRRWKNIALVLIGALGLAIITLIIFRPNI